MVQPGVIPTPQLGQGLYHQPGLGSAHSHPLLGGLVQPHAAPQNLEQQVLSGLLGTQTSQEDGAQVSSSVNIDELLSATIKCKQLRAIDFVRLSNFSYINQLKPSNMNISFYSYGSIRHLLLLSNGTLPPISKEEYNARLQHLLNVLELVCLSGSLKEYNGQSFNIAKFYDEKILQDIEFGYKTWLGLDKCIDSTAWNYAKESVSDQKSSQVQGAKNQQNQSQNSSQKLCTTYNTFKRGESCAFEFNNPGETCVYLHSCSACRQRGFNNRCHKAFNCRDEAKLSQNNQNANSTSTSAPAVPATSV